MSFTHSFINFLLKRSIDTNPRVTAERNIAMEDAKPTEKQSDDNVVFVGRKPTMSYVLACMTLFQRECTEVTLKARGRAINTAVDVAEIMRNRFMTDLKLTNIQIGTDVVPRPEGTSNVSTIEITLSK